MVEIVLRTPLSQGFFYSQLSTNLVRLVYTVPLNTGLFSDLKFDCSNVTSTTCQQK
jgi:hypothetical protein